MSLWRREALTRFPEMHQDITEAIDKNYLWCEFFRGLQQAYQQGPPDAKRIAAIYNYALWSLKHRSISVRTAVVISFFEQLHDDVQIRRDLPRHLSQDDFDMLGFAWEYGTKQEFAELRREFIANKTRIEKEKRTKGNLWHNIPSS